MQKITIYHNPKCSKSRETLNILTANGVEPEIVEYLKTPPDIETLEKILGMLGVEPGNIVRKNEQVYQDLGFSANPPTREELLKAMVQHPIIIERPIVVKGNRAVMGRPPTNVLSLI